jgi:menaquinone-9 beta-reductase
MVLGLPLSNYREMIYDVAIIGGGLAGLSLSLDLRERGYSVCVIEKGNYPRHKVCGEYISNESFKYLHHICPDLYLLKLPKISKFRLSSTGTRSFTTPLASGGFGISRYLLEMKLFERAKRLGVQFLLNTKSQSIKRENGFFIISHKEDETNSKIVCDASGRKSNFVPDSKPATNYVAVKYHIKTQRDPSLIEIHNFPGGYCGVSNIENDLSCLCYIVESDKLKSAGKSIQKMEEQFLYKNKSLKSIFKESQFIFQEPLTISGIDFRIKSPMKDDVFCLGDSSGTIAPITGNGMSNALRAACFLSDNINAYFKDEISFEELKSLYTKQWKDNFSTRINLSRYFQKLSEYPLLCKSAIGAFTIMPPLATAVIKQTHGEEF